MTRKFLKQKEQRNEGDKKEVDRKASKNRKIRYTVHDKIVNFMVPEESEREIPGRDEIVRNLLGRRTIEDNNKFKRRAKDDVRLI